MESQRPPRSVPPPSAQQHLQQHGRSPLSGPGVTFAAHEQGDRIAPLPSERRQQRYSASIDPNALANLENDPEAVGAKMARKRSLVRPDRERIDPSHRQWHYRTHAAQMEEQGGSRMAIQPSSTGNHPSQAPLRRGKSLLNRDNDIAESGLAQFKRATTLRRKKQTAAPSPPESKSSFWDHIGPGPKDAWMIYCWLLTCCVPPFLLSSCGEYFLLFFGWPLHSIWRSATPYP
ncbi:Chitin synthase, class 3 [Serendipita sp. 396]|nr:Chitin synthase, class 3 [Serendipita sp. 396]KAG8782603.1 Chitin synthase, class 3 [Serendipita sp. 397]KAG8816407.1 Chitin synthase, class 3 [Serendipita sp. 401]